MTDSATVEADSLAPDSLAPDSLAVDSLAPDSVAARLDEIMAAQERILDRLDRMEAAGTPGAESTADTAAAESGGLDLDEARDEVRSLGVSVFWSLVVLVVFTS